MSLAQNNEQIMKDSFDMDNIMISNVLDEEAEFIPLLSPDDEEQINAEETPEELPIFTFKKYCVISWGCNSDNCWQG